MASFIYYGVQNRGARKVVTSVHHAWGDISGTQIPANPTLGNGQDWNGSMASLPANLNDLTANPWDPDKTAPPDGRPALTPEERIKVEATRCGAHEVWKQQLPAAPNTGPYGALVGWDWAERNTVTNRWGKVVTQDMLAATVGVSGILPTGSVLVYWGLNAWVSPQPASPWAG
jgi:hypothetical protein